MIKDAPEDNTPPPFPPAPPYSQNQPLLSPQQHHGYPSASNNGYSPSPYPESSVSSPPIYGVVPAGALVSTQPSAPTSAPIGSVRFYGVRDEHHPLATVRARRRFCHGIIYAFVVWFILAWLLSVARDVLKQAIWWSDGQYDFPVGVMVRDCVSNWNVLQSDTSSSRAVAGRVTAAGWPDHTYRTKSSYDLPLNSSTLFLLSGGSLMEGKLTVVTSSEQPPDKATVKVVMGYFDPEIRNLARICRLERAKGENGVGLFTPRAWIGFGRLDQLSFETVVTFPTTGLIGESVRINKFETDVVNMKQVLGKLGSELEFISLDLKGSNAPVEAETVSGVDIRVRSSNAGIQGTFNARRGLSLDASNGVVDVDLGLTTDRDGKFVGNVTSNSPIRARVNLISSADSGTGGDFKLETITSNGGIDVSFPSAPVDSTLVYEGRTSNARAKVTLNPVYEGSFRIQTSNTFANMEERPYVQDPTGRDRRRAVMYTKVTGQEVTGKVLWDGEGHGEEGSVSVHTSNALVTLVI